MSDPAVSIQGRFFVESESLPPTSVAAASLEAVQITGTEVIDAGYLLAFQVNGGPNALTTAANNLTYIAIKGLTGKYYGVGFAQQINAALFTIPNADKINIVTRNQDTAAHVFSGYWQATKPGPAIPGVHVY